MNNNSKQKFLAWSILLLALVVICVGLVADEETAVAAPDLSPKWETVIPITDDSNAPNGATIPVVSGSPDGKTVMIVYNRRMSTTDGDNDPYYRRSLDNGKTWSAPVVIRSSAEKSRQVQLDYDANGVAHVTWQENTGLVYTNEGSKNAGSWAGKYKVIVTPIDPLYTGVSNPFIVASGNNRIDIVWGEGNSSLPDPHIYHIRSKDGGSNFTVLKNAVYNYSWTSQFPSMVVEDLTGVIHLVWQETYNFANQGHIVYSRGTESSGSMNWSSPVIISTVDDAREPEITLVGDSLQVVYTEFVSFGEQYIRHTQCAANCTNASSWQATTNALNSQIAGANGADPLNLVSDIVQWGNCAVAYYHGTSTDFPGDNEIVWGVDSCSGWSEGLRDKATTENYRSLNPNLSVQNNWWMYLAYEQGTTNKRHIYLLRTKPNLFLPVVFR